MQYLFFSLVILSLSAFSCEKKKGQQTAKASAADSSAFAKRIAHKWRIDTAFMHRELQAYGDSAVRLAKILNPGSEEAIAEHMESKIPGWVEGMADDSQEFFPDGRRISTQNRKPGKARYAFSDGLDSLYFQAFNGDPMEALGVDQLTDTTLVLTRRMVIPTIDKSPENRKFFQARYRYVLE